MATRRGRGGLNWGGQSWSNRGTTRGGFAPRGGRGGKANHPRPDISKHPLGELLATLSNADLIESDGPNGHAATITDPQYVASYNWLNKASPTISVPGKPPLWTPPKGAQQLKGDEGDFFRDPNAAKFPSYPTEPAVQAIFRVDPRFPTTDIDILACGSTMGHLLRFVRGMDKPFRFKVEVIGNTVFFVRQENSPREIIHGIHGYGHTFPDAYTTWDTEVRGSETHQRMIRYTFGGMECLIRFECDGYIRTFPTLKQGHDKPSCGVDGLAQSLEAISVSETIVDTDDILTVEDGGSPIHQSSLFDLKTRSGKYRKEIDMDDFLPILYLKQIPNFVVAYHDGQGLFKPEDIKLRSIQNDLKAWETENKNALERLAILLRRIIDMAKKDKRGLLDIYSPSADCLVVHRQHGDGLHALPLALREEWAENQADGRGSSDRSKLAAVTGQGADSHEASSEDEGFYGQFDSESDDGSEDFTACSADGCGYCGRCTY